MKEDAPCKAHHLANLSVFVIAEKWAIPMKTVSEPKSN